MHGEDDARALALVLNVQCMLHVHGNETQRDGWIHRLGALLTVRSGVGAIARFRIPSLNGRLGWVKNVKNLYYRITQLCHC